MAPRAFRAGLVLALQGVSHAALAQEPAATRAARESNAAPSASARNQPPTDYDTARFEPAGFPLIGGNSEIGFEFGVVTTLSRFADGVVPYRWNMDFVLALSVKNGPSGQEITQQSYQWNIDVPQLAGSRIRLDPQLRYYRTVNQLYFGLGNASSAVAPSFAPARYFELDDRQAQLRALNRYDLPGPLDLLLLGIYRYEAPHLYRGSRLERDAAAGLIRGVRNASLFTLATGVLYDTRDNEIFPTRGSFDQFGARATLGSPAQAELRYLGAGAALAGYFPIGSLATIALRGVVDLEFGNVPFYDLYTGGPFSSDEMIGGSSAVRGVPEGRYSGLIKAFANLELRALLVPFELLGERFHLGGNLLFDTGRLWTDYSFRSALDESGVGLKWGAGGGAYLQWGQASLFRIELAYSPDARSGNPGLPLGIYVEDGVMF